MKMKRRLLSLLLAVSVLLGGAWIARAGGGDRGGGPLVVSGGGVRAVGGRHFRGGEFRGRHFSDGHFRGGPFRGGHFRGGHFRGGSHVFIGIAPFAWEPFWPRYVYSPPPVVVQQPAAVYVQPSYWYYCRSAGAYYPYVKQCPEGWQPVLPHAQ